MSSFFKIAFLSLCLLFSVNTSAQQYLVVQKRGFVKNFKYEIDDELSFVTKKGEFYIKGTISKITDSIITLDNLYEIKLDNIAKIYEKRRFLKKLSGLFFIRGGIAYTAIVGINSLINNESPLVDEQTLIISAGMIAVGLALKPFIIKKMDVCNKWQLKVLNFNQLEMKEGEIF